MLQLPGGWGKPVLKVTLKPIAVNAVAAGTEAVSMIAPAACLQAPHRRAEV